MSRERDRIARRLGGRYRFGRQLGAGGMGEVWQAHDEQLDRAVAIKILGEEVSSDEAFVERFRRETRVLAKFTHWRIVTIFEAGAIPGDGRLYMVMELLAGRTLRAMLDDHRDDGTVMDHVSAAVYAIQILEALTAAHLQGIIHRDVKPENTIVTEDGRLKLLDFGIAKAPEVTAPRLSGEGPGRTPGRTIDSTLIGTPSFMAPEVIEGRPADARSDLYAVGVVLHLLLTGEHPLPVPGGDEAAMLRAHVEEAPVLRRDKNPGCPDALWSIVLKFLEKDPRARFQAAEEADAELYPFVRATAPPEHRLADKIKEERKARALRTALEARGAPSSRPPAAKPRAAPSSRPPACEPRAAAPADVTKPLGAGFVPPTPYARARVTLPLGVGFVPPTPYARAPIVSRAPDVTLPLQAPARLKEPFPLARPASRRGPSPAPADRHARLEGLMAGVGLAGAAFAIVLLLRWRPDAGPSAAPATTPSATSAPSATVIVSATSAPSASAAPSAMAAASAASATSAPVRRAAAPPKRPKPQPVVAEPDDPTPHVLPQPTKPATQASGRLF